MLYRKVYDVLNVQMVNINRVLKQQNVLNLKKIIFHRKVVLQLLKYQQDHFLQNAMMERVEVFLRVRKGGKEV